ncbi:hypothetical protein JCM6882_009384 [Rhodosporidiobolus microsporus]
MSAFLSRALSSTSRSGASSQNQKRVLSYTSTPQPSTLAEADHPLPRSTKAPENTPVLARPPSPKTAERERHMDEDLGLAWYWGLW